jgi:hypothetical protein
VTDHLKIRCFDKPWQSTRRWNLISDAPFNDEWIGGKVRAKAFDVLVQSIPKVDENRPEFLLVIFCGNKLPAKSAYFVFHTKHGATASTDAVARRQNSGGNPVLLYIAPCRNTCPIPYPPYP